nr:RNA polymerase sigma factor [Candidatus Gracilibacteria bacterium]
MSEKEIITLCQKGNYDKFGELYEIYFEQIYKFVYLKTYDKSIAQDITSETFFKALDKINTFKNNDDSNFRAWIYRIAYNLIIDDYKISNKKVSLDEMFDIGYEKDFINDIDNKNKLKEIFDFFNTLNPKHKQILIMRLWDDLSYKEILELTGESLDNCKKIVSRTLLKIPSNYMSLFMILLFLNM